MKKLTILLVLALIGLVCSQGQLDSKLASLGLQDLQVSVAADSIMLVEYSKPLDSFKSVDSELSEVAKILDATAGQYPVVVIRQKFDDGEVMEIQGNSADGSAYLSGQLSAEDFSGRLLFTPLTRGPAIIPKVCGGSVSCASDPDCSCFAGESCSPGSPGADERGCIVVTPPENAHLEGSKYVCNSSLVWNSDLSGCVQSPQCPAGSSEVDGNCYSSTTDSGGGDFCLLIFGFLLLSSPFIGLAVLVLIVAVIFLILRKRKK
jgi:hypothetical protein